MTSMSAFNNSLQMSTLSNNALQAKNAVLAPKFGTTTFTNPNFSARLNNGPSEDKFQRSAAR